MYHIPGRSAFKVELETLTSIAERAPNFVGIKHAVDDHGFVTRMLAESRDASRSARARPAERGIRRSRSTMAGVPAAAVAEAAAKARTRAPSTPTLLSITT